MGGVPSTPRFNGGSRPHETTEYLIGAFIGEKSFPLASDYWQKLLELPLNLHWSSDRVQQACLHFAQNNCYTRHLAKILIHLSWCLEECVSTADASSSAYVKALNAVYVSSVFLKHLIENAKTDNFEDLYMSLNESEEIPSDVPKEQSIEHLVVNSVLNFLGRVDVSSDTYLLHYELLNFMLVALSTQLLSQIVYLGCITIMGICTIITLLSPVFSTGKYRSFRAVLFMSMGFFGLIPAVHAVVLNWDEPERNVTLAYELAMALSYLIGTIFYMARIPERWRPGFFDLAGHSHQIFHVFVILGALSHYGAAQVFLEYRSRLSCDT